MRTQKPPFVWPAHSKAGAKSRRIPRLRGSEGGRLDQTQMSHTNRIASLSALPEAAASGQACPLWKTATQTVFGEGTRSAQVMLVGEQPGDHEDNAGNTLVCPARRLLRDA